MKKKSPRAQRTLHKEWETRKLCSSRIVHTELRRHLGKKLPPLYTRVIRQGEKIVVLSDVDKSGISYVAEIVGTRQRLEEHRVFHNNVKLYISLTL